MKTHPAPDAVDELAIASLNNRMIACTLCPRLTSWCQQVAVEKVKRFAHQEYWGKPVPSFGDPNARLLIVGLAPAANGGNRTGRVFTGDRSGDWLYRALYRAGYANQETSVDREDGLILYDSYITAVAHCAPPANKLLPEEIKNCRPYLQAELQLLKNIKVVIALGQMAFHALNTELGAQPEAGKKPPARLKFGHGVEYDLPGGIRLIGSYHPSQQNTFTGKLTEAMFDQVFTRARETIEGC